MSNKTALCYDLVGYNANFDLRHESASMERYPGGRNSSVPYYPDPYYPGYAPFHHRDVEDRVTRHVFIVYKGEFRSYHYSDSNLLVGVWGSLPASYQGGKVGIFVSAHQPTITRVAVVDLADDATPMTTHCYQDGATCNTTTGVCPYLTTSAPSPKPTFTMAPSAAPTTTGAKVAASAYCQGPVATSAAKTVVETTSDHSFLFVDQAPLTTNCEWIANSTGLNQVSEAWGNSPGDNTVMGCVALYPANTYTDFIFEIDVTHQDNDGWGVIFGYDDTDGSHYMGAAINEAWPQNAADGIFGPVRIVRVLFVSHSRAVP